MEGNYAMHHESAGITAFINHQIILLPANKLLSKKRMTKKFVKKDLSEKICCLKKNPKASKMCNIIIIAQT